MIDCTKGTRADGAAARRAGSPAPGRPDRPARRPGSVWQRGDRARVRRGQPQRPRGRRRRADRVCPLHQDRPGSSSPRSRRHCLEARYGGNAGLVTPATNTRPPCWRRTTASRSGARCSATSHGRSAGRPAAHHCHIVDIRGNSSRMRAHQDLFRLGRTTRFGRSRPTAGTSALWKICRGGFSRQCLTYQATGSGDIDTKIRY